MSSHSRQAPVIGQSTILSSSQICEPNTFRITGMVTGVWRTPNRHITTNSYLGMDGDFMELHYRVHLQLIFPFLHTLAYPKIPCRWEKLESQVSCPVTLLSLFFWGWGRGGINSSLLLPLTQLSLPVVLCSFSCHGSQTKVFSTPSWQQENQCFKTNAPYNNILLNQSYLQRHFPNQDTFCGSETIPLE